MKILWYNDRRKIAAHAVNMKGMLKYGSCYYYRDV